MSKGSTRLRGFLQDGKFHTMLCEVWLVPIQIIKHLANKIQGIHTNGITTIQYEWRWGLYNFWNQMKRLKNSNESFNNFNRNKGSPTPFCLKKYKLQDCKWRVLAKELTKFWHHGYACEMREWNYDANEERGRPFILVQSLLPPQVTYN